MKRGVLIPSLRSGKIKAQEDVLYCRTALQAERKTENCYRKKHTHTQEWMVSFYFCVQGLPLSTGSNV